MSKSVQLLFHVFCVQQECCAFLVVPMATLCKCVRIVRKMALHDCKLRCLMHEFLLSTVMTYWFCVEIKGSLLLGWL